MCFDEKIKDVVYLLERRKIRSKSERRKNTNPQLFNGILSGLGLLSSQAWLENSLGVDLMYQLSEKFMECSASPKSAGRYTEGRKGCWTNHFTIQRMCEYKQKVHLYVSLKQRDQRQFPTVDPSTRAVVHKHTTAGSTCTERIVPKPTFGPPLLKSWGTCYGTP